MFVNPEPESEGMTSHKKPHNSEMGMQKYLSMSVQDWPVDLLAALRIDDHLLAWVLRCS